MMFVSVLYVKLLKVFMLIRCLPSLNSWICFTLSYNRAGLLVSKWANFWINNELKRQMVELLLVWSVTGSELYSRNYIWVSNTWPWEWGLVCTSMPCSDFCRVAFSHMCHGDATTLRLILSFNFRKENFVSVKGIDWVQSNKKHSICEQVVQPKRWWHISHLSEFPPKL